MSGTLEATVRAAREVARVHQSVADQMRAKHGDEADAQPAINLHEAIAIAFEGFARQLSTVVVDTPTEPTP